MHPSYAPWLFEEKQAHRLTGRPPYLTVKLKCVVENFTLIHSLSHATSILKGLYSKTVLASLDLSAQLN